LINLSNKSEEKMENKQTKFRVRGGENQPYAGQEVEGQLEPIDVQPEEGVPNQGNQNEQENEEPQEQNGDTDDMADGEPQETETEQEEDGDDVDSGENGEEEGDEQEGEQEDEDDDEEDDEEQEQQEEDEEDGEDDGKVDNHVVKIKSLFLTEFITSFDLTIFDIEDFLSEVFTRDFTFETYFWKKVVIITEEDSVYYAEFTASAEEIFDDIEKKFISQDLLAFQNFMLFKSMVYSIVSKGDNLLYDIYNALLKYRKRDFLNFENSSVFYRSQDGEIYIRFNDGDLRYANEDVNARDLEGRGQRLPRFSVLSEFLKNEVQFYDEINERNKRLLNKYGDYCSSFLIVK
jgi:hypothetical protein